MQCFDGSHTHLYASLDSLEAVVWMEGKGGVSLRRRHNTTVLQGQVEFVLAALEAQEEGRPSAMCCCSATCYWYEQGAGRGSEGTMLIRLSLDPRVGGGRASGLRTEQFCSPV